MKLEIQYTFEEYREANHAHLAPRSNWQRAKIAMLFAGLADCLLLSLFLPVYPTPSSSTAPVPLSNFALSMLSYAPWLLMLFLLVAMFAGARSISAKRQFIQMTGRRRRLVPPQILLVCSVFLAGATMVISNNRTPVSTTAPTGASAADNSPFIWLIPAAIFGGVCIAVFRGAYRKNWKLQPSLARPRTLEYSPEGVGSDDGLTSSMHRWPAFLKCIETKNLFLLYPSGLGFIMVPKRAFPSPEAVDGFRRLIDEWADGRSVGFPVIQAARS